MRKFLLGLCFLLATGMPAWAGDISGTWQTEKPRFEITFARAGSAWQGEWFNLGDEDGSLNGNPLQVKLDGSSITLTPYNTAGVFHGTVSADGKTITGDWGAHFAGALSFHHVTAKQAFPIDPAPHKIQFVTVAPGVKLEVLDFGGTGKPLVFLAGLGRTAHNFDTLATKFTGTHHVYAVTRRGLGASDAPPATDENYDADRLGDDVLAVLAALHIEKPVVAGHSIAGQELSSIGSRHPEKLAGLVYLDAAYGYAFYDPSNSLVSASVTQSILRRDLKELQLASPSRQRALIAEIRTLSLALQQGLKESGESLAGVKDPKDEPPRPRAMAAAAILANGRSYRSIKLPLLVLAAVPQRCDSDCDGAKAKAAAASVARQAEFVATINPQARLVRLAHADHFVWKTHQADVVREMTAFMDRLPR